MKERSEREERTENGHDDHVGAEIRVVQERTARRAHHEDRNEQSRRRKLKIKAYALVFDLQPGHAASPSFLKYCIQTYNAALAAVRTPAPICMPRMAFCHHARKVVNFWPLVSPFIMDVLE